MARQWPLPEGTYRISSRFAGRTNPVTGKPENHSGTDFAAPDGTPFYAVQAGTVKFIGKASGYGQWLVVDSSDAEGGGCAEYGHMWNAFATGLKVGSKVKAGQLLGYIGSNGQSTGPHLHLTIWQRAYGGTRVDPETWLSGKPHPPKGGGVAAGGTSTTKPPSGGTVSKTLIGIDVSKWQDGLHLAPLAVDFCIIRLAYGSSIADAAAVSHAKDWTSTGKPISFYHYLTPGDPIAAQADLVARQWKACGAGGGVWIDVEEPGITRTQVVQFRDALRTRGVYVIGAYSRANFWEALPGGEPKAAEGGGAIWVSHYGSHPAGPIRSIYPGDNASQWFYPLGDRRPDLWQWTDKAIVPGWTAGVDANAYKGTVAQLRELFTGKASKPPTPTPSQEDDMALTPDQDRMLREVHHQLLNRWPQLGNLTLVDALALGLDQVLGPYKDTDGNWKVDGWPHLGKQTVVDAVAEVRTDVKAVVDRLLKKGDE